MKGKVFGYGRGGDPLIKDDNRKVVILKDCSKKPDINKFVDYIVFADVGKVSYAYLAEDYIKQNKNSGCAALFLNEKFKITFAEIHLLWNENFKPYFQNLTQKVLLKTLI